MCIQVPQRSATSDAQLSTKSEPEQDTSTASDGTDISEQVPESSRTESDQSEAVQQPIIFRTPAQEKLQNEISALNAELHAVENDLDALILATNAPGRSVFNHVE